VIDVRRIYGQESPFKARNPGTAQVLLNAATHIENHLSHHDSS
jgi:tRNA 2-selenouridine synthase